MAKLPPFMELVPIGLTAKNEQVRISREFRDWLGSLSLMVGEQDGAAPGGQDFVMFPTYPTRANPCAFGRYPISASPRQAVRAAYQTTQPAAVTAQYSTGCGSVTFARY